MRFNSQYKEILKEMTLKDIKARYKHAFLGFFWVILTPLLQMFIIATLFSFIIKTPIKDYYIFLFCGLLLWNFFAISVSKATTSIVDQRSLITKAKFTRNIIPISVVLSNFFHLIVSITFLLLWVLVFGKVNVISILLLPVVCFWILALTLGVSFLLSAYNVRYRDVSYLLQIALQVMFYATPVIYPLSFIPSKYHLVFALNPITSPIMLLQSIFDGLNWPSIVIIVVNLVITVIIFWFGCKEFSRLSSNFDDWV